MFNWQCRLLLILRQQLPTTFIPEIDKPDDVFDYGCLCEIKIREKSELGVYLLFN